MGGCWLRVGEGRGYGEKQMQFIVIYGIRFIYGGLNRLPGDWEGAGLGEVSSLWPGRVPILGAEGSVSSWASLPLPGPLGIGSCPDEACATCKCPPTPCPQCPTPTQGP